MMTSTKIRTYSELMSLPTFEERFNYLRLDGSVGKATFGYDRYLNQSFYNSYDWKKLRRDIIVRDNACDLAVPDHEIYSKILIHHMNPIDVDDILHMSDYLIDPEYLITVSYQTHNAIHYANDTIVKNLPANRKPNDTCPWKQ